MNAAHVHLLVNHIPIVGAILSVPILALALVARSQRGLALAAAVLLTLGALGTGVALRSGEGAEDVVEKLPDVHKANIETHEERAEVAAAFAVLAALASIALALVEHERSAPAPRVLVAVVLAVALGNAGAMAWTGASGGVIRHTEIRGSAAATSEMPQSSSERTEQHERDDD